MSGSASATADALARHIGWSRVGAPPDAIAWLCVVLAVAVVLFAPALGSSPRARRAAIGAAAAVSSLLSAGYVVAYLRGGPRIIDATAYYLEARALAAGHLAWDPGEPAASVVGRFLVRDVLGDGTHVAVIFPPGYPAYLAPFFWLGAPMASGPVLAALLTLATAWLASEVAARLRAADPSPERGPYLDALPVVASWVSAVCAALRYHTADTMSHGLAATLATVALSSALRLHRDGRIAVRLALGGSLGWCLATRPVTGACVAVLATVIVMTSSMSTRRARSSRPATRATAFRLVAPIAIAATPGIALFLLHQRAATGAWLHSSQSLYYALSDGPAGCFRYGFGAGVGCEHEHGTFVAANLPDGYGAYEAAATCLRRLKAHLVDALSSELAFALVPVGLVHVLRSTRAPGGWPLRVVALAPVALLLAYAPFYFDGNYPGGGARMLADALPLEHVLAALGAAAIAGRLGRVRPSALRVGSVVVGASLAGFAVRASYDHALLRDRDGGAPAFEPAAVAANGITRGLLFTYDDAAFNLGHDPDARADRDVAVVRHRDGATDTLAWLARGKPPTFHYLGGAGTGRQEPMLKAYPPLRSAAVNGASLTPPVLQDGAYTLPGWPPHGDCTYATETLEIVAPSGVGIVEIELPRALAGQRITPRLVARVPSSVELEAHVGDARSTSVRVSLAAPGASAEAGAGPRCIDAPALDVPPSHGAGGAGPPAPAPRLRVTVEAEPAFAGPRTPIVGIDVLILDGAPY